MRVIDGQLEMSATDLSQFLGCRHLTALNIQVARGTRRPPSWTDPMLRMLMKRGLEHERGYIETLRAQGLGVTDLSGLSNEDAIPASIDAMRQGADFVVQPAFRNEHWFGRPDVLRRIDKASSFRLPR